ARTLAHLRDLGADWISITPFGFQRSPQDATFRWGGGGRWGESDDRLREVTAQAHALGLKVMLKPHLWLRPPAWCGEIDPGTPEGWRRWFDTYDEFLAHYAALAREAGIDALCVGNELERSVVKGDEWRRLIARARSIYPGPLTYGASWSG